MHSFAEKRRRGATTLWEYWPESLTDRSHNHPLFGAVVAYLYDYLLGIRNKDGSAGYREREISPVFVKNINRLEGHRTLPGGKVSVVYERKDGEIFVTVSAPENQHAEFIHQGKRFILCAGENRFVLSD